MRTAENETSSLGINQVIGAEESTHGALEQETLTYGNGKTSYGNCEAIVDFTCCDGNAVFPLNCHVYARVDIFMAN